MNPYTESREAVVEALSGLGVTVYGAPPETVTPPAMVIVPGQDVWSEQVTFGAMRVNWSAVLMASMSGSNAAAMERLEQLVWDVRQALNHTALVGHPSQPRIMKFGPAEVAVADVTIQVHVTTEETP